MLCSQFRNFKIIYRRYAGLYFCICVDVTDNNLAYLEGIHNFVEVTAHDINQKSRLWGFMSHDLICFQECLLTIALKHIPSVISDNLKTAFLLKSDTESATCIDMESLKCQATVLWFSKYIFVLIIWRQLHSCYLCTFFCDNIFILPQLPSLFIWCSKQ